MMFRPVQPAEPESEMSTVSVSEVRNMTFLSYRSYLSVKRDLEWRFKRPSKEQFLKNESLPRHHDGY